MRYLTALSLCILWIFLAFTMLGVFAENKPLTDALKTSMKVVAFAVFMCAPIFVLGYLSISKG